MTETASSFKVKCNKCNTLFTRSENSKKCPECCSEDSSKCVSVKLSDELYNFIQQEAIETGINNVSTTIRHIVAKDIQAFKNKTTKVSQSELVSLVQSYRDKMKAVPAETCLQNILLDLEHLSRRT